MKLNHREAVQAALEAIDLPIEKRGFFGLTIAINIERIPELKNKLKHFIEELQEEFAEDREANSVYRINSHCFPMAEIDE